MSIHPESDIDLKLDFDDLVKELDQFEREAVELQDRISSFMTTATEAAQGPELSEDDSEGGEEVEEEADSADGQAETVHPEPSHGFANAAD
jgi:hypothetical protein